MLMSLMKETRDEGSNKIEEKRRSNTLKEECNMKSSFQSFTLCYDFYFLIKNIPGVLLEFFQTSNVHKQRYSAASKIVNKCKCIL